VSAAETKLVTNVVNAASTRGLTVLTELTELAELTELPELRVPTAPKPLVGNEVWWWRLHRDRDEAACLYSTSSR
jgi:hypothetical protein